jgi:hypothetical protein
MTKKLSSILEKFPHATVTPPKEQSSAPELATQQSNGKITNKNIEEMVRIIATVPKSFKKQMQQYILDHEGETEKSLILKGLRTLGFIIDDKYLEDKRKVR